MACITDMQENTQYKQAQGEHNQEAYHLTYIQSGWLPNDGVPGTAKRRMWGPIDKRR